jgi:hypothetical protein
VSKDSDLALRWWLWGWGRIRMSWGLLLGSETRGAGERPPDLGRGCLGRFLGLFGHLSGRRTPRDHLHHLPTSVQVWDPVQWPVMPGLCLDSTWSCAVLLRESGFT